jgi:PAT family beta-lactamase induction signal transducer AmpG
MPLAARLAPLRDRRFLMVLALGFASGLPLPLSSFTLRQWFAESQVSMAEIGLTALIGLSYSLKFLWAPLLDQAPPPLFRGLGRRRGWIASIQLPLAAAILALGFTDPSFDARATALVAVLVAFLSASQDVVVDAHRVELLEEQDQGYGLACYVWGYRGAMWCANAGALFVASAWGWTAAFAMCAALVGVGFLAVLLGQEPAAAPRTPRPWGQAMREAVVQPFTDFMRRRWWLAVLLFIALFKLGEALGAIMAPRLYRELGFTRNEVAWASSTLGLWMTLAGALAGGWLVSRLGTARALVLTGLGQMLSNLMYVALAQAGHDLGMLYAQSSVEAFTDGLADAAFLTYLASLTNRAFTATQYALLASLASVPIRTLGASSGWLAAELGWVDFYLLTTAAALPAMALMLFLLARMPPGEGRTA